MNDKDWDRASKTLASDLSRFVRGGQDFTRRTGRMADKVVARWEARRAFDDVATPLTFVEPYAVMLPDDPHITRSRLIRHSLQFDIAVALTRPMTATRSCLVALTGRGEAVGAQSL